MSEKLREKELFFSKFWAKTLLSRNLMLKVSLWDEEKQ